MCAAQQAPAEETQGVGAEVDAAAVRRGGQAGHVAEALITVQLQPLQRGVVYPETCRSLATNPLQSGETQSGQVCPAWIPRPFQRHTLMQ